MLVTNKKQMYRMLKAGMFGNTLPFWDTLEEYFYANYPKKVGIRSKMPAGLFCKNVPPEEVEGIILSTAEYQKWGYSISPMALANRSIQGMIWYDELWWTDITDKTIRQVYEEKLGKNCKGLLAQSLLRTFLWDSDYADLQVTMERYPGAVVEFTCFDRFVGTIPHRNTIIWEVRHY